MLAREAEWKQREVSNNVETANWAMEAPDSWGNTPPTSPVQEGWLGVPADATWPPLSDTVLLCPGGWPDLSPQVSDGVRVTIEVLSNVESLEEHSTCRSLVVICCLLVPDLLSSLCHSTVGTSVRSCAPCHPCGRVDEIVARREYVA
jgi:hypothetical protein